MENEYAAMAIQRLNREMDYLAFSMLWRAQA